jgi:hypothetical protein
MFADYKCLVLQDYRKKRAENILPPALVRPSPARLKKECMRVCSERFDRRVEKTLKDFFEQGSDRGSFLQAIGRFDNDRLKPLGNFLKGVTNKPDDKIIELLAWLIGFTPRPFDYSRKYPPCVDSEEANVEGSAPEETTAPEEKPPKPKKWKPVIRGLALILAALGLYWLIVRNFSGRHACMYWVGDHYRATLCSEKHGDTLVVELDSEKMAHFRKITRPDTITENALGSIWYANFQGVYECYTSPGFHPVDTNLKLRPLTDYVLLKHIRPGWPPDKTAQ